MRTLFYAGHSDPGFMINALHRMQAGYPGLFDGFEQSTPFHLSLNDINSYASLSGEKNSLILCLQDAERLSWLVNLVFENGTIARDVNSGRTKVFLDFSNESGSQALVNEFIQALENRGVCCFDQVFIVCQNRQINTALSGRPIQSLNFDFFLIICCLQLSSIIDDEFIVRVLHAIDYPRLKADLLCLNATPRFHRLLLLIHLFSAGFWGRDGSQSIISFPGYTYAKSSGLDPQSMREYLLHNCPTLVNDLVKLETLFPLLADNTYDKMGNELAFLVDCSLYLKTKISIVTETGWDPSHERITEKTLKPLLLGHPLYVLGHPGTSEIIENLGFRLIQPDIQRQIDSEADINKKCEIITVASKDFVVRFEQSEEFRATAKEVSFHNMKWAQDGFISQYFLNYVKPLWSEIALS